PGPSLAPARRQGHGGPYRDPPRGARRAPGPDAARGGSARGRGPEEREAGDRRVGRGDLALPGGIFASAGFGLDDRPGSAPRGPLGRKRRWRDAPDPSERSR